MSTHKSDTVTALRKAGKQTAPKKGKKSTTTASSGPVSSLLPSKLSTSFRPLELRKDPTTNSPHASSARIGQGLSVLRTSEINKISSSHNNNNNNNNNNSTWNNSNNNHHHIKSEPNSTSSDEEICVRTLGRAALTSSGNCDNVGTPDPGCSTASHTPQVPLSVQGLTAPGTASLFAFSVVQFRITSESKNVSSEGLGFEIERTAEPPTISNGRQHRTCVRENGLLFRVRGMDRIFLMIELLQKKTNRPEYPTPVTFCSGKCSKKKTQVVEIGTDNFYSGPNGEVAISLGINEQCAHKSESSYGSPKTLFYLSVSLLQFIPKELHYLEISNCTSHFIKIVAPGKAKEASTRSTDSGVPVSTRRGAAASASTSSTTTKKIKVERETRSTKGSARSRSLSPAPLSPLPTPTTPNSGRNNEMSVYHSNQMLWDYVERLEDRLHTLEQVLSTHGLLPLSANSQSATLGHITTTPNHGNGHMSHSSATTPTHSSKYSLSTSQSSQPVAPSTPGRNVLSNSQDTAQSVYHFNSDVLGLTESQTTDSKLAPFPASTGSLMDLSEVAHNLSQEEERSIKFSQDSLSTKNFRVSGFFANSQTQSQDNPSQLL